MATPLKVSSSMTAPMAFHRAKWQSCTQCAIGQIAHEHVFTRGTLPCEVLFVGEAPGKTEDVTGWPFIGKSGKMLDDWIERACAAIPQCKGEFPTYAITNIVLCRPCDRPGGPNRAPSQQEIINCKPRFEEFVRDIARPRIIVTVGRFADENRTWSGIPTETVRHPGYVLRIWNKERNAAEQQAQVERLAAFMSKELYGKVISH